MLTSGGLVKIVDFGIAKVLDQTGPTRTGLTLGTVAYMAPEQVTGHGGSARRYLGARRRALRDAHRPAAIRRRSRSRGAAQHSSRAADAREASIRAEISRFRNSSASSQQALTKDRNARHQSAHEMTRGASACWSLRRSRGEDGRAGLVRAPPRAAAGSSRSRPSSRCSRRQAPRRGSCAVPPTRGVSRIWSRRDPECSRIRDRNAAALAGLEDAERLGAGGHATARPQGADRRDARPPDRACGNSVSIEPYGRAFAALAISRPHPKSEQTSESRASRFRWKLERERSCRWKSSANSIAPSRRCRKPDDSRRTRCSVPAGPVSLQFNGFNYLAQRPGRGVC